MILNQTPADDELLLNDLSSLTEKSLWDPYKLSELSNMIRLCCRILEGLNLFTVLLYDMHH